MNDYVKSFYDNTNDALGLPQKFKGIEFYPIKIKEIKIRSLFYKLFYQPKNYIADREVLKMSYLKFILFIIQSSIKTYDPESNLQYELIFFLQHITRRKNIKIDWEENKEENSFAAITLKIFIDDIEFSEFDFDNLREIILEQNGSSIEYIESYNQELENKMRVFNKEEETDFKDEFFAFCCLCGLSEIEASEKTLYQFKSRLERKMIIKEYELFKPLELSGQVTSKSNEEIFKHYLSHIPQSSRYGSILIDKDKFMENNALGEADSDGNIK